LPSRGGIGDFCPAAYQFVDFLVAARQGLWQVLPLGPPANGNSPYSSTSAFAGNPLLVSLERLASHGWIAPARLTELPDSVDLITIRTCVSTNCRCSEKRRAIFWRVLQETRRPASSASAPTTIGGWKISSFLTLCAIVT